MQMNTPNTINPRRTTVRPRRGAVGPHRRASAMVIILGVLALVALVGLALITKTHTEAQRVTIQATSSSEVAANNGVIRLVQDILRRDIWGDPPVNGDELFERPLSNDAPPGSSANALTGAIGNRSGQRENNEPYDAPGVADRWLSSIMPYELDPADSPVGSEGSLLAWDNVSYVGSDIVQPRVVTRTVAGVPTPKNLNPFMWAQNERNPADPAIVRYDASSLSHVPIVQRPISAGWLLPGSTTNVSPKQGRLIWSDTSAAGHQAQLAAKLATPGYLQLAADVTPQYPYFDTNGDGIIDLWDADGDGVPDSPLSLIIQLDSPKIDAPSRLYAAVRIVDHAGMLNLNTASSETLPDGTAFWTELRGGLQQRGRSVTEMLVENALHREDWLPTNAADPIRSAESVNYRLAARAPDVYDYDFVRRSLIGGYPELARDYRPFDLEDEASLRHRNSLVRYDRTRDVSAANNDYSNVDRAFRNTMLWSREVGSVATGSKYTGDPRWSRLNSNFQEAALPPTYYEGYSNATEKGWRDLMDEDELFAVRKPMLTTVSTEVVPPPDIGIRVFPPTVVSPVDRRLRQLWSLGMDWPTLMHEGSTIETDPLRPVAGPSASLIDNYIIPQNSPFVADWMRPQRVDLNMGSTIDTLAAKADFIRYCAAAMHMALEAGSNIPSFNYQGMPLTDSVYPGASLNREYLAWQFAVNLADYRDADSVPTYWGWRPTSSEPVHYVIGVEKQPFFTEAYVYLTAGNSSAPIGPVGTAQPPSSVVPDKWFYAYELFVPPGWSIPTDNLYFRTGGPGGDLTPLRSFRLAGNTLGGPLGTTMDGGPADIQNVPDNDHGNYYVFCSDLTDAPPEVRLKLLTFPRAYVNPGFQLPADPTDSKALELVYSPTGAAVPAANELPNAVLDIIGPTQSGGELAADSFPGTGLPVPGTLDDFAFAKRPPYSVMPEGATRAFSLRRSTKGWRFTTAWQIYSFAPGGFAVPRLASFNESLGASNQETGTSGSNMDDLIPESIWPALTSFTALAPEDNFLAGNPYAAFDSAGDLSRMLMVGPVDLTQLPTRPILLDPLSAMPRTSGALPATLQIAEALTVAPSGNAPFGDSSARVAAGRVDFVDAYRVGSNAQPWTLRLLDLFTTQSPLHDTIDNDGDGLIDFESDPTEAVDVLFRAAGRINLNTAPATVLRTVPFSSLLPTSPALAFYDPVAIQDPLASFLATPNFFWDLPTAIIARREGRTVPLRLTQGVNGIPQIVAEASISPLGGGAGPGGSAPSGTGPKAFTRVADLWQLENVSDRLNNRNELFHMSRFHQPPTGSGIALYNHIIPERDPSVSGSTNTHPRLGAVGSPYSPDFRYRPGRLSADYVPIETPTGFIGNAGAVRSDPADGGGVRGRDIFLSRLTNLYTTRSDVFTVYIALIDEDGNYVHRSQLTLDRSVCFRETLSTDGTPSTPVLPKVLTRSDGSYTDDTK